MSIQPTHGNPAVQQAQSNHQPPPHQSTPPSSIPQDKVTISPEAKAQAAGMVSQHKAETK